MSLNIISTTLQESSIVFTTGDILYPAITILPDQIDELKFYGQNNNQVFLKNIKDPIDNQDVATKNYISNVNNLLYWKTPAYVYSENNIDILNAPNIIDGITLTILGTRVLINGQTNQVENGI